MMKRASVAVLLLCMVGALPARADDASKRAKVEQLLTVLKVNRITEQITQSVRRQLEGSMRTLPGVADATPEQKKLLDTYESQVMSVVDESVSWKALQPQIADLYFNTYTEAELDGLLAFYRSPVGQSLLTKGPELSQKSMGVTQSKLAAMQPKINEISQNFAKQWTDAHPAAAKPSTPAATPSPK